MSEKLLTANENTKLQNQILDKIREDINDKDITNDTTIDDMIGVSWLDGYADIDFGEVLSNNFDIDDREDWADYFDELKHNKDHELAKYYDKASQLLTNGDDPMDIFLKSSPKNDSKLVSLTHSDMMKLFDYLKKYVKQSKFTADAKLDFELNKADLSVLIG